LSTSCVIFISNESPYTVQQSYFLKAKQKIMRALKTLGLVLGLSFLVISCQKDQIEVITEESSLTDKTSLNGKAGQEKISFCKDGKIKSLPAFLMDKFVSKGYAPDADGDGYFAGDNACGPVDCDDTDATINPDAEEICDDMIDNNCNGLVDCEETECNDICASCDVLYNLLPGFDLFPELVFDGGPASYTYDDAAGVGSPLLSIFNGSGEIIGYIIVADQGEGFEPASDRFFIGILGSFVDVNGNEVGYFGSGDDPVLIPLESEAQFESCSQYLADFFEASN